jgi:ferric-dicitrate binding protein FerR (iron transport regulator)
VNAPLRESDAARAGRGVQSGWGSTDVERALAATHARLRVRKQRMVLGGVGFVVAMAAAFLLLFTKVPTRPLETLVVLVPKPVESVTHFADGSEARSSAGSKVVVRTSTATAIETALDSGEAEFSVVPNPERRFVVHAGGVTVEVVGTRFRVKHQDARVLVEVSRGKVRVTAGAERAELVEDESRWFARGVEASPTETAMDDVGGGVNGAANAIDGGARSAVNPGAGPRERFVDLARRGD